MSTEIPQNHNCLKCTFLGHADVAGAADDTAGPAKSFAWILYPTRARQHVDRRFPTLVNCNFGTVIAQKQGRGIGQRRNAADRLFVQLPVAVSCGGGGDARRLHVKLCKWGIWLEPDQLSGSECIHTHVHGCEAGRLWTGS